LSTSGQTAESRHALAVRTALSILIVAYFLKTVGTFCCVERLTSKVPIWLLYVIGLDEGQVVFFNLAMILILPTFAVLVVRQIIHRERLKSVLINGVILLLGGLAFVFWADMFGFP
jgi:drug/metabolite transporter (DMT)-like permease